MGLPDEGANTARRFFIGIGVGTYDEADLNLPKAESDVVEVAEWFTTRSGVAHLHALANLGKSPKASEIVESLRGFLQGLTESDVVVIYIACHGELEGARAHLFGRDTPSKKMAGRSIDAVTLGAVLGQSKPHNVLLIIDACVAGRLASAIMHGIEDAVDDDDNKDPHRKYAQIVVSSTYGRDPAFDGRFAEAFLNVVSNERWTGTSDRWLPIEQLITGLNEELSDLKVPQVADQRAGYNAAVELIPNPNVASRQLGQLIADEEFKAHFDPSARGVARGEQGSFFTGRDNELKRIVKWLRREDAAADAAAAGDRVPPRSLLVITGSPGSGKSALLSRVAVLADPAHRPGDQALAALTEGTVPPKGALDAVVWCHNKSERQIIDAMAAALGGSASNADMLLPLALGRSLGGGATIAIDALDEIQDGLARRVARNVLWPLSMTPGIRLLVATRRRPVRDGEGGKADLLDQLGADPASVIDLDAAPDTRGDMRAYVEARIRATRKPDAGDSAKLGDLADRIAEAAGSSFLVAAIAARSAAAGGLTRADGTYALPTEVGEALAGYIEALPDPSKTRGLLRPLAWSSGAGLPWGTLWPRAATALAKMAGAAAAAYDDGDVRELLDQAGDLIVESVEAGQPVYRLFHEALAEHLRAQTDEARSHGALADAMRELVGARPWPQVQPYITANLPKHLLKAGRLDDLLELLADPTWDRCRREQTGDPLAAVGIADAAVERLLVQSPTDLRAVALCVVYSRAMSTAAPLILDVIARSGQLARAEMMANNLAYTPDRMQAYRYLCGLYARARDKDAARRCFEEVRRSLPAMPETHQPMAWFWVAEAADAAGLADGVSAAARASVEAAFAITGDGWDLPNGYFWAARACGLSGAEDGTLGIRAALDSLDSSGGMTWRNQALQAASAARHFAFLEKRLDQYFGGLRFPIGMIRDGNIALALAAAGMHAEAHRVFELVGNGAPQGNEDSNKRWCWALALCGRMDEAVRALSHVHDPIEKSKAIARIASVARERNDNKPLEALRPLVRELLAGRVYEARGRARLVRELWLANERAEALRLAEQEIAVGQFASPLADPRDGIGPEEGAADPSERGRARKAGRREMVSSVVPIPDELWANEAEFAAGHGKIDEARQLLQKIAAPSSRARALAAIAKNDPDREQAIAGWLRAMAEARRAGRGAIDRIQPLGIELLNRAGRADGAKKLNADIEAIEARWQLESFSEQYEGLRKTMPPGGDRTRQMTALLYVPGRLAGTHSWTLDDIRRIWASGEDGKRLFALGLIQGAPFLAVAEVLTDAIRGSRDAFEQHEALLAALEAKLDGDGLKTVLNAVDAEVRGIPRPDGVDSGLTKDAGRTQLAKQLLARGEY